MSEIEIRHGPEVIHPEKPSAVGSRNSLYRDNRDEYSESRLVIDEEVDKILNHIHSSLPPEVLSRLDVTGSVKSKLHVYFNQTYQNMLNRYLTTVEDEHGKKVRDLIDHEEMRGLNRYSPRPLSYLLDRVGGADRFNTSEIEKSIVNIFGHLQGHIQRAMNDLETHSNSLLRRKSDVGGFVRGENAYAISKCSFRDHPEKSATVSEIKLAINVLNTELISPIYGHQASMSYLLKEMIGNHIKLLIDQRIEVMNNDLIDEGKHELTSEEKIFRRVMALEDYTADEDTDGSARYALVARKFLAAIEELTAESMDETADVLGVRENIFKIIDSEDVRNRGYNTAVNAITQILDTARMGYQHIENFKAARKTIIREYVDTNPETLPDERYQIELCYHDKRQLEAKREAYRTQLASFDHAIIELWDVVEAIYQEYAEAENVDDWGKLSERLLNPPKPPTSWLRRLFSAGSDADEEDDEPETPQVTRVWNEIQFIQPGEVSNTENPTLRSKFAELEERFPLMREKLVQVFGNTNPELRIVVERRLEFLEREFYHFDAVINPYHVQPGLLLDIDIVTIKRKSTTMTNMANVLNEFLSVISKGFADQAFAQFSRRRSTEREDFSGEFASGVGVSEFKETRSEEAIT